MARKHFIGECIVWMSRGYYNVSIIESVSDDGYHYKTSASSKIFKTFDRFEAHQIQYMLNGWGLPEFTLGNTQRSIIYTALEILDRHSFNRNEDSIYGVEFDEMYAKANVGCFKAILSKIKNVNIREALRKLWITKYQMSKGEITIDAYDVMDTKFREEALTA